MDSKRIRRGFRFRADGVDMTVVDVDRENGYVFLVVGHIANYFDHDPDTAFVKGMEWLEARLSESVPA